MPLPSKPVSFNRQKSAKRLAAKARPAEGYFPFVLKGANAHEPKDPENFDIMSKLDWRMLENANDTSSMVGLPFSTWFTWPIDHPDNDEHQARERTGPDAAQLLAAFFPKECDDVPRRNKRRLEFQGVEITKDEEAEHREDAVARAGEKSQEVYNDHALFVGKVIWARLFYGKDSDDFPRLGAYAAEQDTEREVSTTYVENFGGGDNGKPNGDTRQGRGSKRGASKKSSGRSSKREKRGGRRSRA